MSNNPTAFVLLDREMTPDMGNVAAAIRRRHPGIPTSLPEPNGDARPADKSKVTLLFCAGKLLTVMPVLAPLPADAGLLARASATWPEARAAFEQCKAHLIVAVMGDQDQQLPAARAVTAVAGGVIAAVPGCLGVVWGGNVASQAERWLDMSKAAFARAPHFPSPLWYGVHPFRDERTGGVGAVTQGLTRFVGRELELVTASTELRPLLARIDGLARYLMEKGPVLKDGSTFGVSETERVSVRLCTSERFPGLAVIAGYLSQIERQARAC